MGQFQINLYITICYLIFSPVVKFFSLDWPKSPRPGTGSSVPVQLPAGAVQPQLPHAAAQCTLYSQSVGVGQPNESSPAAAQCCVIEFYSLLQSISTKRNQKPFTVIFALAAGPHP